MKKLFFFLMVAMAIPLTLFSQSDSIGVYACVDGVYKAVKPIHYQQVKIGVGKASNLFANNTSALQFSKQAKFRLYFGSVPLDKIAEYYIFGPGYSIDDYGIGQFKVKKESRQLSTVSGSIFGMKTGTTMSNNVSIITTPVRNGVYDISVTGKPGEYCVMLTRNGIGAYVGVFDFSLLK